jgi:hypothetical protein
MLVAQKALFDLLRGRTGGRKRDTIARSDNAIITVTTRANIAIDVPEYALIPFYEFIVCCLMHHFDEKQVSKGFGSLMDARADASRRRSNGVTSASVWTRHRATPTTVTKLGRCDDATN